MSIKTNHSDLLAIAPRLPGFDCRNLPLYELPAAVMEFFKNIEQQKVSFLDFSRLNLRTLPSCLRDVRDLGTLYLSQNQIQALPMWIEDFKQLSWLHLNDNALREIPPEVARMVSLRNLHLSNNRLHSIPKELFYLKNLTILDLSRNHISSLPTALPFESLQRLFLQDNLLRTLPMHIATSQKLKDLNLSGNPISKLPVSLGMRKDLETRFSPYGFISPNLSEFTSVPVITNLPPNFHAVISRRSFSEEFPSLVENDMLESLDQIAINMQYVDPDLDFKLLFFQSLLQRCMKEDVEYAKEERAALQDAFLSYLPSLKHNQRATFAGSLRKTWIKPQAISQPSMHELFDIRTYKPNIDLVKTLDIPPILLSSLFNFSTLMWQNKDSDFVIVSKH